MSSPLRRQNAISASGPKDSSGDWLSASITSRILRVQCMTVDSSLCTRSFELAAASGSLCSYPSDGTYSLVVPRSSCVCSVSCAMYRCMPPAKSLRMLSGHCSFDCSAGVKTPFMTPSKEPATSAVTTVACTSLAIVSGCTGLVGSLTNASILSHRDVLGGTRVVTTSLGGTTASLALPLVPWVGSGGRSRYAKSLAGLTPERNSIVAASCSYAMREGG